MKGKVLIVDDDPKIGRLLKFKLAKSDYDADYFTSGSEALEKIPEIKPHLIISDIQMPRMNGYEFCERLRQNSRTAGIPFIFLSARTDTSDQLEGLRLGADDYVCKPVKIDYLLERMDRVLDRAAKAKSFKTLADFSGNLSQMSLNDVIQIVEANHKTGELEFTRSNGKTMGQIFFKRGNLVKAQVGGLEGTEAFYSLMDEEEGYFEFYGRSFDDAEQITITNMAALLQGSRLIDEAKSFYQQVPNMDVFLQLTGQETPAEMEERYGKDKISKIITQLRSRKLTACEAVNSNAMSRPRAAAILAELMKNNVVDFFENDNAGECKISCSDQWVIDDWLVKVLKNIESRGLTGTLEIGSRRVREIIFFKNGQIINAFHGSAVGQKALYRIFSEKGGAPKFQAQPVVINRIITEDLEFLLDDGNWEASTLGKLRRIPFNNMITVNPENVEKASKAKKRPGLIDVLTLVQQHGHVQDVINASPLTDLRTYNHLLTLVKLGIINIEKNDGS